MAFVVSRPNGAWEIRESRSTGSGPRSRTLASFRTLTPEVVERALERSAAGLDEQTLVNLARRSGAPVATSGVADDAAALVEGLAAGGDLSPTLRRLTMGALGTPGVASAAELSAGAWLTATPARRGDALRDLLLLADRIPVRKRSDKLRFPRLESSPA